MDTDLGETPRILIGDAVAPTSFARVIRSIKERGR